MFGILIHALAIYYLVEFTRALPIISRAVENGTKPWACAACMAFWMGGIVYLLDRWGVWLNPLATLGLAHIILRVSWAVRANAEWVESTRSASSKVHERESESS